MPFRGSRGRSGNAIVAGLVVLLVVVVGAGAAYYYIIPRYFPGLEHGGTPGTGNSPCLFNCGPATEALPITTEVFPGFDPAELSSVENSWGTYLGPGDMVDIYSSTVTPASISTINSMASTLRADLPAGVLLSQNSVCLPSAEAAAQGASLDITYIASTYEPQGASQDGGCGGSYSFPLLLSYFSNLTTIAHNSGKKSIAYVTGDPLLNPSLASYGWNYGTIAKEVDHVTVEVQQWESPPSTWGKALSTLKSQFAGASQPLSKLTVQIDVGVAGCCGPYFTNATSAIAAANAVEAAGITGGVYIWVTGGGYEPLALAVLQGLR